MKGENKEINIRRSEEFTLAGRENTMPSPSQPSPKMFVFLSPRDFSILYFLSFCSLSKGAAPEGYLAFGVRVHTENETKQGKLGSDSSLLILLHNGDEQYLHNNILGC